MAMELSKTPLGQVREVKHLLMNEGARNQLAAVAAKHMNPERMMRVTANAIRVNPKLGRCEPMSFLGALMQCAALGLEPNTVLGHAYLIPFENKKKGVTEVQVIVGYKGLIDLARRSGHITSLAANIHYEDDELWDYEEGTEARLRHRPGSRGGKKLHAYAIAKFKDGGHAYVVLPWAQVMKTRDESQSWQTAKRYDKTAESPWAKHEDEMAKKTAIRALAKYLPLSIEFTQAVEIDGSNADYRSYAFDPTAGVAVDEVIDGEAQDEGDRAEHEAVKQIEEKAPAPELNLKPRQKVKVADEPTDSTPMQSEADLADDKMADKLERLAENIIDDIAASSADEVEDVWSVQIEMIRQKVPSLGLKIDAALKDARR